MSSAHTERMSPAAQYAAMSGVPVTSRRPVSSYVLSAVKRISCETLRLVITATMGENTVARPSLL